MQVNQTLAPRDDRILFHRKLVDSNGSFTSLIPAGETRSYAIDTNIIITQQSYDGMVEDKVRSYIFGYIMFKDGNGQHKQYICNSYFGNRLEAGLACDTPPDK